MIGFMFRLIPPWAWAIVLALVAAALFAWGHTTGSASMKARWDLATAQQVKAQLEAEQAARATEQALQAKVQEAQNALTTEKARHARIAAGLRADADKLRNDIAGFAGGAPDDTLAACRERAATLGTVLDGVLSDYRACTVSAEATAADLRAVLDAWPK